MFMEFIGYILKPDWFNKECIQFYQRHYWLWCLKNLRLKCIFGFHKWIDCGENIGAYCDNCPMDKDADGNMELANIGVS